MISNLDVEVVWPQHRQILRCPANPQAAKFIEKLDKPSRDEFGSTYNRILLFDTQFSLCHPPPQLPPTISPAFF